jgi:2-polyprenyl-6-methoxyphenol hydroxylase-like FAD-dependent oxidoreductase
MAYDVIVVGARCAGAALALHLARAGRSVALLDAAHLPSGQPTSTHLIQPPGLEELEGLGVATAVRRLTPALRTARLSFDGHEVRLAYTPGRPAHCLRRETLDRLLQDAAVDAGAELRPQSRVVDVTRAAGGSVSGVELQGDERLHAPLVVGADGRNSTIAKHVGAAEYLGYDGPRSCYWAYWQRPASWDPHELANVFQGNDAYVVFPTDGDLLLIASAPPIDRASEWRADHAESYLASVRSNALIGPHLGDEEPVSKVRGVYKTRYYFRASAGPGWALIGDAGHHKDFFAGLGISDALRDAHGLSRAIVDGEAGALGRWWRQRDVQRIALFRWAAELGRPEPVDALRRLTAAQLADAPDLHSRLGDLFDGRISPFELVPTSRVARWVLAAMLRGDPSPLPPLLGAAWRRASAAREERRRKRALRGPTLRATIGPEHRGRRATAPLRNLGHPLCRRG